MANRMHSQGTPIDRRKVLLALSASVVAGSATAQARDAFPSKPIQLVLPFPPGGSMDPIFRSLAEAASRELGQPVVLMHKPAASWARRRWPACPSLTATPWR